METLDQEQTNQPEQSAQPQPVSIELQKETLKYLNETRKWGYFLAILGFIFIGIMIVFGLFIGLIFSKFMPPTMANSPFPLSFLTPFYIVLALVYLFPTLYLFRFSTWTKKGVSSMSSGDINQAFKNLKSLFRFIGILTIVMMSLYALFFVGMMIFGLAKAFI